MFPIASSAITARTCRFNSFLKKYGLTDPALILLGEIVRAADSYPNKPHRAGEGLRWIAHGFSALGLSDPEILEREFILYDACIENAGGRRQPEKASTRAGVAF